MSILLTPAVIIALNLVVFAGLLTYALYRRLGFSPDYWLMYFIAGWDLIAKRRIFFITRARA